ncbi:MAG: hypothetical protein PHF74_05625 [Dehalococcoidales bacterium]|nr:hypothetical protein [Dehalococcoidales bacterium]
MKNKKMKGKPIKGKGKVGRPKHILTDMEVNKILALYQEGKTDAQVAKVLGLPRVTFLDALKNTTGLTDTIKKIKETPDHRVEMALFERALGYDHKAVQFFCYEGVIMSEEYVKHYPPEVSACVFWLCNRQPERWKNVQKIDVEGQVTHKVIEIVRAK